MSSPSELRVYQTLPPKYVEKKIFALLLSSISRSFLKTASDFWWSQLTTPDTWDKNDLKYNITNINWTYINDFPGHQFLFTKWELWSQLISLLLPKIAADIRNGMKSLNLLFSCLIIITERLKHNHFTLCFTYNININSGIRLI